MDVTGTMPAADVGGGVLESTCRGSVLPKRVAIGMIRNRSMKRNSFESRPSNIFDKHD